MLDQDEYVESSNATFACLVIGTPVGLPYEENFTAQDIDETNFWWSRIVDGGSNWEYSSTGADDDGGSMAFTCLKPGDKAVTGTRKISLDGAEHPMLAFSYYCNGNSSAKFTVTVNRAQSGSADVVMVVDMAKEKTDGWKNAVVDLSKYKDDSYILVEFAAEGVNAGDNVAFDNVSVKEAPEKDIQISMTAPASAHTGQTAIIDLTVMNVGYAKADGIMAVVTASYEVDGEKVETVVDQRSISSLTANGGKMVYRVAYVPTPFALGEVTLSAEAVFEDDTNTANNMAEATIVVASNDVPAVNDLVAEADKGNVSLTWSAPAGSANVQGGISGYRVYVDGALAATVEGTDNTTQLVGLPDGQHDIYITVLYGTDRIESPLSNVATVVTAIRQIVSGNELNSMEAVAYTLNGAYVAKGKQLADKLQKGVYIIKNSRTGQTMTFIK